MQNPVREVAFGGQAFPLRHRSFHHLLKGWSFRNRTNSWPSNLKKNTTGLHRIQNYCQWIFCTRLLGKKVGNLKARIWYEWNMKCFRGVSGKRHDPLSQECASKSFEPWKRFAKWQKLSSDGHKRYQVSFMANKIRSRFFHHMSTWATFFGGRFFLKISFIAPLQLPLPSTLCLMRN